MPTIIFTTPDGKEHNVTVDEGVTVMEAGRDANLGIEGTCGGCLSCATCHVIVDPDWYALRQAGRARTRKTCWILLSACRRPRALDARSP